VYDIAGNTWDAMSTTNAPAGRFGNVTLTDQADGYMFVWGGITGYTLAGTVPTVTNTGGTYDLLFNNTWYAMAGGPLAARMQHAGVWTGSRMIIWGGQNGAGSAFADGASYNLGTNTWTSIAPSPLAARYGHTATWTGSKMIIYGGTNGTSIFNDGAAYDPVLNTWSLIAPNNIFLPQHSHTALWTGTDIIVFGGINAFGSTANCVRYNAGTNSWSGAGPVPGESSTSATVTDHRAVWTGTEMIVAGGTNGFVSSTGVNIVRAYNPSANTWRLFNVLPQGKIGPVAVWTGSEFIIQGGSFSAVSGYKYNPAGGSTQDIEVSQSRSFYKYKKN
jgi:N-acetylneuraminic acid mutarotase